MWLAAFWGAVAGCAVLIGALASLYIHIKKKYIGYIMSYGTGILIGAAAYELLGESVENAGLSPVFYGFIAGALVYTVLDLFISRKGGLHRKRSTKKKDDQSGLGIFIGTVMDAIPESIMIGASLLVAQSVSWSLVIAIFISNIPEGLSSTVGMKKSGFSTKKIWVMWIAVLIVSTASSLGGYLLLDGASDFTMAAIAAFAGGGIIAMVASTMMPEAFDEGGPIVGFIASMGLLTSLLLQNL